MESQYKTQEYYNIRSQVSEIKRANGSTRNVRTVGEDCRHQSAFPLGTSCRSENSPLFTELEDTTQCPHEPLTAAYHGRNECNLHIETLYFN